MLGPLEEKEAMNGAGFVYSFVSGGDNVACGLLCGAMKGVSQVFD